MGTTIGRGEIRISEQGGSGKLQERLQISDLTLPCQKVQSNILRVFKEPLRILVILQVFLPLRRRVGFGLTFFEGLKTSSKPSFTHRGPTPNINATSFPGCNLGPPRQVPPLVALSCSGVSIVKFIKEKSQTG